MAANRRALLNSPVARTLIVGSDPALQKNVGRREHLLRIVRLSRCQAREMTRDEQNQLSYIGLSVRSFEVVMNCGCLRFGLSRLVASEFAERSASMFGFRPQRC